MKKSAFYAKQSAVDAGYLPPRFSTISTFLTKVYNMQKSIKKIGSRAFTLVELLIVIAIIGVLAGLIFPSLTRVLGVGSQVKSMNNARNIANAWMSYAKTGSHMRVINKPDIYQWIKVLADKQDLNNPSIWILDFDPLVASIRGERSMPISIVNKVGTISKLNPEFKAFPISWEVANNVPTNAEANTPLVWTRGLKSSGTWDEETGVFGAEGGHIAFVDAHVAWYPSLKDEDTGQGLLNVYNKTFRTFNIASAIKGGAKNILKSKVNVSDDSEESSDTASDAAAE